MAKFFTNAKIFVRNIVHFLLDELCTSRMFRVPFRPKEIEIITIQEEKKLWTFPKTSVRIMSSCQHFCLQSRQYLFTKPLGLTAVRSCRNLIFRRYCYQNVNLPVPNVKEKEKLKGNDEKVTKHNEHSKGNDFHEIKENKSNIRNIMNTTSLNVEDLSNDDILENNLFNSTQDVEIVGSDDVANLNSDHVNRLPLNLQNLINEVEIETQVFSELLNDTHVRKNEKTPKTVEVAPLKPFKAKNQIPDLSNISKNNSHLIDVSNNTKSSLNTKNKVTKLDDLKKLVQSQTDQPPDVPKNVTYNKTLLDPPNKGPLPILSIKEIQNLAKKMCAKHVIKTDPKIFQKPVSIAKPKIPESIETKSKIPINKPHTVDAFSQIPSVQLPKVDLEQNPVLVERKNRMEMIKRTLQKVKTVEMDSVDEIKTMSNAMLKDPKAPTLLTLASRNRYNIGEGVAPPIKVPFRITKDANRNMGARNIIKEQPKKNVDEIDVKIIQQGVLSSEDIRKKFNPLSSHLQRPGTVPLYSSNLKRQVSSQISKMSSEEVHHKSRLPLPKTIIQQKFNSIKPSSSIKSELMSQTPTKVSIKEMSSIPVRSSTTQKSKVELKPKVAYDNMTRNMNTPARNSWSSLLSHANKKQILQLKQPKRFCSSTSGYDSDFSNDTESGGAFDQDDMNQCKEDDYNMIEVKVKKNLPYLQSHRPDSSINLTGLVDRSIAQELRMQEIEDRKELNHDDVHSTMNHHNGKHVNEVVITTGTSNAQTADDPEFDSIHGIYCNQVLCPTSSDVLTRYMNFSSQTESEDLKTKIKCMTSENKELVHNSNNNDNKS